MTKAPTTSTAQTVYMLDAAGNALASRSSPNLGGGLALSLSDSTYVPVSLITSSKPNDALGNSPLSKLKLFAEGTPSPPVYPSTGRKPPMPKSRKVVNGNGERCRSPVKSSFRPLSASTLERTYSNKQKQQVPLFLHGSPNRRADVAAPGTVVRQSRVVEQPRTLWRSTPAAAPLTKVQPVPPPPMSLNQIRRCSLRPLVNRSPVKTKRLSVDHSVDLLNDHAEDDAPPSLTSGNDMLGPHGSVCIDDELFLNRIQLMLPASTFRCVAATDSPQSDVSFCRGTREAAATLVQNSMRPGRPLRAPPPTDTIAVSGNDEVANALSSHQQRKPDVLALGQKKSLATTVNQKPTNAPVEQRQSADQQNVFLQDTSAAQMLENDPPPMESVLPQPPSSNPSSNPSSTPSDSMAPAKSEDSPELVAVTTTDDSPSMAPDVASGTQPDPTKRRSPVPTQFYQEFRQNQPSPSAKVPVEKRRSVLSTQQHRDEGFATRSFKPILVDYPGLTLAARQGRGDLERFHRLQELYKQARESFAPTTSTAPAIGNPEPPRPQEQPQLTSPVAKTTVEMAVAAENSGSGVTSADGPEDVAIDGEELLDFECECDEEQLDEEVEDENMDEADFERTFSCDANLDDDELNCSWSPKPLPARNRRRRSSSHSRKRSRDRSDGRICTGGGGVSSIDSGFVSGESSITMDFSPSGTLARELAQLDLTEDLDNAAADSDDHSTLERRVLWPSLFPNVPGIIRFFHEHDDEQFYSATSWPTPLRRLLRWRYSTITPVVVRKALHRSGFRLVKAELSDNWIGCWGKHLKSEQFRTLKYYQKINHFPGTFQMGRKDRLWRNIQQMSVRFSRKEFGFLPLTFILPRDLKLLRKHWDDEGGSKQKWIIKPPASARGNGVYVINTWRQIPKKRPVIVQRYLSRPYLIRDFKFDLRIYVYITSFDPLIIYMHEDGLARFASCAYSNSSKTINNRYMHLTNYSINKKSAAFMENADASAEEGHKWTLKVLWQYLRKRGVNTLDILEQIRDIVVKTVISSESAINSNIKAHVRNRYCVHELFGFDIMLDQDLKPWLIEVNISPSLHSASPLDVEVKDAMATDLLNLAGYQLPPASAFTWSSESTVKRILATHFQHLDERLHMSQLSQNERDKHLYFVSKWRDSTALATIFDRLTPDDIRCLVDFFDQQQRRGRFECIFPTRRTQRMARFLEQPRYYNILLQRCCLMTPNQMEILMKRLKKACQREVHLIVPESTANTSGTTGASKSASSGSASATSASTALPVAHFKRPELQRHIWVAPRD